MNNVVATQRTGLELVRHISSVYWPPGEGNCSAKKVLGDAAVDRLTLGELLVFYTECTTGPTYCMVTRRVQEVLKQFLPHIEAKRSAAVLAMASAKAAFNALADAVSSVD
jgi:hypothetical protein